MSERGFFVVDRGLFDHPMFAPEPFTEREAWQWLIANAAWKPTKVRVGRGYIELERGQLAHSVRFLAQKWKWSSESKVHRFLKRLTDGTQIDTLATRDATRITICNYDKYQFGRRTDGTQTEELAERDVEQRRIKEGSKEDISSLRSDVPPTKPKAKRGTRISETWRPSERNMADAKALGLTTTDIEKVWPRFRDYWLGAPGQKGVKLDWDATWRNWCDKEAERLGRCMPSAETPVALVGSTWVHSESQEWRALAERYRREKGRSPPLDRNLGWQFPDEWISEVKAA